MVHAQMPEARSALAGVVLFSPEVNLRMNLPSIQENASSDILPWNIPTAAYLDGINPGSPAVSAISQDPTGWLPTFVSIGSDEMFRDSIRRFSEHLDEAGVDTVATEEAGMFHVFPILMPWSDASRHTIEAVAEFMHVNVGRAEAA